jgi:hypothetical protein
MYGGFRSTKLGHAIVKSSLTPEDGIFIHTEMRRALEPFVMDREMHIFYLFTPIHTASDISWPVFREELERLDESAREHFVASGSIPASSIGLSTAVQNSKSRLQRRST